MLNNKLKLNQKLFTDDPEGKLGVKCTPRFLRGERWYN